jgi:uncharacterized protein (TIGR02001 family)
MKRIAIFSAAAILAAGSTMAIELDAELTLDFASAYVFRGVTFNDGFVIQPGMSVSGDFGLPFSVGTWANFDVDDYDGALEENQFSEIDLFGSVSLPMPEGLAFDLGYCEYTYPSGGGDADREVSATLGLDIVLAPSVMVAYGVDGGIDKTLYVEAGIGQDIDLADGVGLSLGAAVGYVDPDGGESGFSHYNVSASLSFSGISAGVTYVGQIDDDVLADVEDGGAYDVDVFGTIGVSYDF